MLIEVYADIACPWCYIGERRLARALAQRPDLPVERHWRPFQLQPGLPPAGLPWAEFVQYKFGGLHRAQTIFGQVGAIGAADGITFNFDRIAGAPNTRDSHRLILLAAEHGREWETVEALFAAYFADGRDVSNSEELAAVAAGVGLDGGAVRDFLAGDAHIATVDASQAEAHQLGISGVPFYIFDGRYGLSGAQPVEVFLQALDLVAAEANQVGVPSGR